MGPIRPLALMLQCVLPPQYITATDLPLPAYRSTCGRRLCVVGRINAPSSHAATSRRLRYRGFAPKRGGARLCFLECRAYHLGINRVQRFCHVIIVDYNGNVPLGFAPFVRTSNIHTDAKRWLPVVCRCGERENQTDCMRAPVVQAQCKCGGQSVGGRCFVFQQSDSTMCLYISIAFGDILG